jgi:hypothetical protein
MKPRIDVPVESRASPPGWTGETPVPLPYNSYFASATASRSPTCCRHIA